MSHLRIIPFPERQRQRPVRHRAKWTHRTHKHGQRYDTLLMAEDGR